MLKIRAEQYAAFSALSMTRFEDAAVQWVQASWPEEYDAKGDEAIRIELRDTVERCRARGIEQGEHVLRYLNLCYALGPDFETAYPWAKRPIERAAEDPGSALEELELHAERELDADED